MHLSRRTVAFHSHTHRPAPTVTRTPEGHGSVPVPTAGCCSGTREPGQEAAPTPAGRRARPRGLAAALSPNAPRVLTAGSWGDHEAPGVSVLPHGPHHEVGVPRLRLNSPGPLSLGGRVTLPGGFSPPRLLPSRGFPRAGQGTLERGLAARPASLGLALSLGTTPHSGEGRGDKRPRVGTPCPVATSAQSLTPASPQPDEGARATSPQPRVYTGAQVQRLLGLSQLIEEPGPSRRERGPSW